MSAAARSGPPGVRSFHVSKGFEASQDHGRGSPKVRAMRSASRVPPASGIAAIAKIVLNWTALVCGTTEEGLGIQGGQSTWSLDACRPIIRGAGSQWLLPCASGVESGGKSIVFPGASEIFLLHCHRSALEQHVTHGTRLESGSG